MRTATSMEDILQEKNQKKRKRKRGYVNCGSHSILEFTKIPSLRMGSLCLDASLFYSCNKMVIFPGKLLEPFINIREGEFCSTFGSC